MSSGICSPLDSSLHCRGRRRGPNPAGASPWRCRGSRGPTRCAPRPRWASRRFGHPAASGSLVHASIGVSLLGIRASVSTRPGRVPIVGERRRSLATGGRRVLTESRRRRPRRPAGRAARRPSPAAGRRRCSALPSIALDERSAGALDGVGAGLVHRFARRQVPLDRASDIGVIDTAVVTTSCTVRAVAPHGDGRVDQVGARRQRPQHPPGVVSVGRFAEDLTVDLDRRVGGEHDDVAVVGSRSGRRRRALARARRRTSSTGVSPGRTDSSTSAGTTSNGSPSRASSSRRRGDPLASTSRIVVSPRRPPSRRRRRGSSGRRGRRDRRGSRRAGRP